MKNKARDYKLIRDKVKEAYMSGNTNVEELCKLYNIRIRTLYIWMKKENWKTEATELKDMEKALNEAVQTALLAVLKRIADEKDPASRKDLQSTVGLLKQYKEQNTPHKHLNEHVIVFCDDLVSYAQEKNLPEFLDMIQENTVDLAEYLRMRHNG
jgi:hypothetical protein